MSTSNPAMTGARTDAIELLTSDHREVEQFFRQYEAATHDDGVARHAAEEIIKGLSVHAAIEEMILYPTMRKAAPEQEGLVDHSLEEHQEVKELLARVDGKPANDAEVRKIFGELKSSVEEHVSEEEGKLFPALRRHVKEDQLMELGEKMAKAKAMAPTHPHPNAPNTPPGNIVAGPFAALADKVRDFLRQ
jgi:hemerythrin superfamily protein